MSSAYHYYLDSLTDIAREESQTEELIRKMGPKKKEKITRHVDVLEDCLLSQKLDECVKAVHLQRSLEIQHPDSEQLLKKKMESALAESTKRINKKFGIDGGVKPLENPFDQMLNSKIPEAQRMEHVEKMVNEMGLEIYENVVKDILSSDIGRLLNDLLTIDENLTGSDRMKAKKRKANIEEKIERQHKKGNFDLISIARKEKLLSEFPLDLFEKNIRYQVVKKALIDQLSIDVYDRIKHHEEGGRKFQALLDERERQFLSILNHTADKFLGIAAEGSGDNLYPEFRRAESLGNISRDSGYSDTYSASSVTDQSFELSRSNRRQNRRRGKASRSDTLRNKSRNSSHSVAPVTYPPDIAHGESRLLRSIKRHLETQIAEAQRESAELAQPLEHIEIDLGNFFTVVVKNINARGKVSVEFKPLSDAGSKLYELHGSEIEKFIINQWGTAV